LFMKNAIEKSPREPGRTEDEIVIRHYCLQGRDVDWK